MKSIILTTVLTTASIFSFAQDNKDLTDNLLKDKQKVLAKYIPMANGDYANKAFHFPLDSLLVRVNAFNADYNSQISTEKNAELRELKKKDALFYSHALLYKYQIYYGSDSVAMENMYRMMEEKRSAPNFYKLIDSARLLAFPKRLSTEERARIEAITGESNNMNDAALFKTSRAYRVWLQNQLAITQRKKYPADMKLGYGADKVAMLKTVASEISDPYIKQYLLYTGTETVIKSVKSPEAKENAYNDFMAIVSNPVYKKGIEEVYTNYKNMAENAMSPDFNYTDVDGKSVSLKSLRGKYVYIDVWATWCGPCKAEIPFLAKVEYDYKDKNIHFVSLSVDQIKDKAKWVKYVKDNKLGGIQIMADKDFNSDFVKKYNINSIPRFLLIDPAGKIVSGDAKRPSDPQLRKQFDTLLK
ncbi:MAG: TlpA disulfide reductase family protein [Pedobacter sp.]|uniref:TlpA family protein disulfide reductase n=1 Tax=Pedobacter sp. TaxID=1411316 RepID=UPI003567E03E